MHRWYGKTLSKKVKLPPPPLLTYNVLTCTPATIIKIYIKIIHGQMWGWGLTHHGPKNGAPHGPFWTQLWGEEKGTEGIFSAKG